MYRELDFENVHDLTNGHEAIKYAQRSFMERFFKLISFGKCEKYANYREKFSFTRKVKFTCFVTVS